MDERDGVVCSHVRQHGTSHRLAGAVRPGNDHTMLERNTVFGTDVGVLNAAEQRRLDGSGGAVIEDDIFRFDVRRLFEAGAVMVDRHGDALLLPVEVQNDGLAPVNGVGGQPVFDAFDQGFHFGFELAFEGAGDGDHAILSDDLGPDVTLFPGRWRDFRERNGDAFASGAGLNVHHRWRDVAEPGFVSQVGREIVFLFQFAPHAHQDVGGNAVNGVMNLHGGFFIFDHRCGVLVKLVRIPAFRHDDTVDGGVFDDFNTLDAVASLRHTTEEYGEQLVHLLLITDGGDAVLALGFGRFGLQKLPDVCKRWGCCF